ncbi:MAG: helix-turn-helix domain-containing protein [Defluviitaleaceae bacterium]|nr:helix-turn-helix domain-containing protein [Defluviitaleaceae bacterium]MCL2261631.1 helix-turn-helix domain-containing protein [Defluviitaleaceae bacterium]
MFYAQIKKLCDERGKKITAVTVELGFSKGSLSQWKNGSNPTADAVVKFANYFDVATDYLLTGKHPQMRHENKKGGYTMKKTVIKRRVGIDVVKNGMISLFIHTLELNIDRQAYSDNMTRFRTDLTQRLCEVFADDVVSERINGFVALTLDYSHGYTGDESEFPVYSEFLKMMKLSPPCKDKDAEKLLDELKVERDILEAEKKDAFIFGGVAEY